MTPESLGGFGAELGSDFGPEDVIGERLEAHRRCHCSVRLILIEERKHAVAAHVDVGCVQFVEDIDGGPSEELVNTRGAFGQSVGAQLSRTLHVHENAITSGIFSQWPRSL